MLSAKSNSHNNTAIVAYILGILIETGVNELLELFTIIAGELWRIIFWYEEEHSHWVQVAVWGFALCQLYCSDAQ